jgi:hypothetical protein
MNEYDVKRLALVYSLQAKIEGMKAENKSDLMRGQPLSYTESYFRDIAHELEILAYKSNEEL